VSVVSGPSLAAAPAVDAAGLAVVSGVFAETKVTAILICSRTGYFGDDVPARCAQCDASIVHRPHVDPSLVKMCESCAAVEIAKSQTKPETRVTDETLREVALFKAKTKSTH
jgi:hypothetical protein